MHYCTVILPIHLFLTMKSPEHAQIWILKLPPTSRPNYGRIKKILKDTIWAATWQNQQNECAPSEDSDQHGHPSSLIRVFAVSMGIHPVWSESSLSAWIKLGSLATHSAHSEDSDQTGRMPRLICVFAGRTVILLVLSWGGSYNGIQTELLEK